MRRYKESQLRRQQNKQFNKDQRSFYRQLERQKDKPQEEEQLDTDDAKTYWEGIWQVPVRHNEKSKWIQTEKDKHKKLNVMPPIQITTEDIRNATQKTLNWRSPGIDNIHNYWYKKLTNVHEKMAMLFSEVINHPQEIPPFMTMGLTYLLPKTNPPNADPSKYRPITCLPTMYKILTSVLAEKITNHLEDNNIIAEEQKGSRKNSRGCKEQLIIDSVITGDAKKNKKPLHVAYIDYKKAFDSVPHTWLADILDIYKVNPQITQLLKHLMERWQTKLFSNAQNQTRELGSINIQRGIFQGDSLSALWFCLAMNPLSTILNKEKRGYEIGNTNEEISHLLYMDDLKLYSSTKSDLQKLLKKTEIFSHDIKMEMGLDKCRINSMKGGTWTEVDNYQLKSATDPINYIKGMHANDTYKYLGFEQNRGISHKEVKQNLIQETKRRTKIILKTKLSGKNITTAVNTYALPVLIYSFGVIQWTETDLDDINRQIRVLFSKHRAHHPRCSVERFHLSRNKGGRGIVDIKNTHYEQIRALRDFFKTKAETSRIHRATNKADNKLTPLNLKNGKVNVTENITTDSSKIQAWKSKELHGRYIHKLEGEHIDKEASLRWVCNSNIFPETEGFMMAIQDQVILTRTYKKYIMKETIQSTSCRVCNEKPETIEHILSGCSVLAPKQYTKRHNNVARIVHQHICHLYDSTIPITPYYRYEPQNIVDLPNAKIYWNRTLRTDRPVQHNRPDITIMDKDTNTTYLIDISIPAPANMQAKQRDKIDKYLPLAQDVKEVWQQQKVIVVPMIIGVTGEIPMKLHEATESLRLPSKLYKQLQKVVILESCSIMRQVLNQ